MPSSGGDDVPAARAAAAVNDLFEAREGVSRLRTFLLQLDDHRAPCAEQVADGVLDRLSSAMSALGVGGAAAEGHQSPAAAGSDGAGQQQSVSSGGSTRKRRLSRRSQRPSDKRVTAILEDGHVWRKYGQKEIQNSRHPRSYYRCTHRSDQGCNAKRHVQLCESNPPKYVITYYGEHTCRDPSTLPLIVHAAGTALDGDHNLISFAPSYTAAATSSQLTMEGSVTRLSSSQCTSDDVFSSSAGLFTQVDELGAAVVGSAGAMSNTVVSAPDSVGVVDMPAGGGGADAAGTSSFPSSPDSFSWFAVGSLGIIADDDDDFPLDP
ncbi:hypothetical protein ACP70R_014099 [Stipagrostis hirtigluma subsp. patula]